MSVEIGTIGAHGVQVEVGEEGVRGGFADRALTVVETGQQVFGGSGRDGGVLKDVIDDGACLHPGRDEDGGHAHAEPVKMCIRDSW